MSDQLDLRRRERRELLDGLRSRKDLAVELGYSYSYLEKTANGRRSVTSAMFARIQEEWDRPPEIVTRRTLGIATPQELAAVEEVLVTFGGLNPWSPSGAQRLVAEIRLGKMPRGEYADVVRLTSFLQSYWLELYRRYRTARREVRAEVVELVFWILCEYLAVLRYVVPYGNVRVQSRPVLTALRDLVAEHELPVHLRVRAAYACAEPHRMDGAPERARDEFARVGAYVDYYDLRRMRRDPSAFAFFLSGVVSTLTKIGRVDELRQAMKKLRDLQQSGLLKETHHVLCLERLIAAAVLRPDLPKPEREQAFKDREELVVAGRQTSDAYHRVRDARSLLLLSKLDSTIAPGLPLERLKAVCDQLHITRPMEEARQWFGASSFALSV